MAAHTVAFSLTSAAWQDISGGYEIVSFRLPMVSSKDNVIRVNLGTTEPDTDTTHFDQFMAPQNIDDEWQLYFSHLTSNERLWVRAARAPLTIAVYRK